jgi:hypothetical protein
MSYEAADSWEWTGLSLGYLHFHPFVVMCDRSRDMGENVFPPSVGVAIYHDDSYEYKCSMVPRNDGNYQPHAWATYTFIRLWLCAMVREKMTEKWAIFKCPPRCGEHKGVEHGKKNATTS